MKSMIVYGPAGCGKTHWAARIAKHFGLKIIIDDWYPSKRRELRALKQNGVLYLATCDGPAGSGVLPCMSFAEVAQQINAAIPLTDWFPAGTKPVHPGVYERLPTETPTFQHWDGNKFGYCSKSQDRCMPAGEFGTSGIQLDEPWRGLSQEPILLPEQRRPQPA